MRMSGSELIIECLMYQGVDTVFGYPGGAIMPLYDVLYEAPIRHILTVHEQGAAHAADGYARSSGRVGVCIATSGPGATNLVTGLATAYMDSSPIVAITGQVPTSLLGHDAFQEVDITGITMPITKHNFLVRDISELEYTINLAFTIAASGRPGPVLIDIPKDILLNTIEFHKPSFQPPANHTAPPKQAALEAAVSALANASQPIVIIGGGVNAGEAWDEIYELISMQKIPVVSTLMGLGSFPGSSPYFLGLTGMHGHKTANHAVHQADVVLAVGTRFNDRLTGDPNSYASGKTVIQLDLDPSEMDKNFPANVIVVGQLRQSLKSIKYLLSKHPQSNLAAWWEKIHSWQQTFKQKYSKDVLNAPWVMRYMSQSDCENDIIWVTDVGQHQMWAAQHLELNRPRTWLTSGGLGTMGFGVPAALGAQSANPDKRVVLIVGDGGFKMTGMDLYTIANQELPIITVIINNQSLGMVKQWQYLFFNQRYSSTILVNNFNFVAFAAACGIPAKTVFTADEFAEAYKDCIKLQSPSMIVVNIDPDSRVEPMVSPGSTINQFIDM